MCYLLLHEDVHDLLHGPADLLVRDDEGRGQSDNLSMGFLGENSSRHQPLTERPGRTAFSLDLDADEQALASHLFHVRGLDAAQALHEEPARAFSSVCQVFINDDIERGHADGAGQRVAAEGASVVAGCEDAHDLGRGQERGHGVEATGQRLADGHAIRPDAVVLEGEQLARAPESGLDFIAEEEGMVLVAEFASVTKVALRRYVDASFSLDRLDQEGHGVAGEGRLESFDVTEGHNLEARGERTEAIAVLVFRGEADDGGCSSVEVVCTDDDLGLASGDALDLVAPLADRLDARLHRLGAGVHREGTVEAGKPAELLEEGAEVVGPESAAGQSQPVHLLDRGLPDSRMAMALVESRIRGQHVQVFVVLSVPDPDTAPPCQDDRQRMVVVSSIPLTQFKCRMLTCHCPVAPMLVVGSITLAKA